MDVLGVKEWFTIFQLWRTETEAAGLNKLKQYFSTLSTITENDDTDVSASKRDSVKIAKALQMRDLDDTLNCAPQSEAVDTVSLVVPNPVNPLVDMSVFSQDEKASLTDWIENPKSSQLSTEDEECYPMVPIKPLRLIEFLVSECDSMTWHLDSFTQLAPISEEMWIAWAMLSAKDIEKCKNDALMGNVSCRQHTPAPHWPMSSFMGKYKCFQAGELWMKMDMPTGNGRS